VRIVWPRRAIRHLVSLRDYIARDKPDAAEGVARTLLAGVDKLVEFPNIGRPGRVVGTRELIVPTTPFVIAYRLRGDRLEVLAVFHGHQKWPLRL
jgi:addiction module RelE/StbE family toxin